MYSSHGRRLFHRERKINTFCLSGHSLSFSFIRPGRSFVSLFVCLLAVVLDCGRRVSVISLDFFFSRINSTDCGEFVCLLILLALMAVFVGVIPICLSTCSRLAAHKVRVMFVAFSEGTNISCK